MASRPSHEPSFAPRVGVVGAQLAHVVAQEVEAHVAEDLVDVFVREHGVVLARHLRDAAKDQPAEAPQQLAPRHLILRQHTLEQRAIGQQPVLEIGKQLQSAHSSSPLRSVTLYRRKRGAESSERCHFFEPRAGRGLGRPDVRPRTACETAVALRTRAGADSLTHRHNAPRARVIQKEPKSGARCLKAGFLNNEIERSRGRKMT